jgi:hypothetical protein
VVEVFTSTGGIVGTVVDHSTYVGSLIGVKWTLSPYRTPRQPQDTPKWPPNPPYIGGYFWNISGVLVIRW